MSVEKTIHQSWKTKELSNEQSQWVNSVKNTHTDYEHVLWTDADNDHLIESVYPEFLSYYNTLTRIEKCDFIRPLYVHHRGGIYLDLDVVLHKCLSDVLVGADVFLHDHSKETVRTTNFFLPTLIDPFFYAGEKGNPFFYDLCHSMSKRIIYNVLSSNAVREDIVKSMYTGGPFLLTKFYLIFKNRYNIKVLEGVIAGRQSPNPINTHGMHLMASVWGGVYTKATEIF